MFFEEDRVKVIGSEPGQSERFPHSMLGVLEGTVRKIDSLNRVLWVRFEREDGGYMDVPLEPWELEEVPEVEAAPAQRLRFGRVRRGIARLSRRKEGAS